MKIKTLCSLTLLPTLILLIWLLTSTDNYVVQTNIYNLPIDGYSNYEPVNIALDNNVYKNIFSESKAIMTL